MKQLVLFTLLLPLYTFTMDIAQKNLFIPSSLGTLNVVKAEDEFIIIKNEKSFPVKSDRLDSALRKMDNRKLALFLKTGYLSIGKSKDGSYRLQSHMRLSGGGPVLASVLYGATKGLAYAIGLAAGGAAVAATAGTATGPILGGLFAWLAGSSAVTAPVAITAGIIGGSTTATAAATTLTAAGGSLGFVSLAAAIEAAALAAYTAGMVAPTP